MTTFDIDLKWNGLFSVLYDKCLQLEHCVIRRVHYTAKAKTRGAW